MLYDPTQLDLVSVILHDQLEAGRAHANAVAKMILEGLAGYPKGHACTTCGSALPEFGKIICDDSRGEVRFRGKFIRSLTGQEWSLFRMLMNANGRTLSKENLLNGMYQLKAFSEQDLPEIKIIDVFVCKLRKKIAPLGITIQTAWGRGYYLEEPTDVA